MEDFFRLFEEEVDFVHTAVEQRTEETWNQNSANTCKSEFVSDRRTTIFETY